MKTIKIETKVKTEIIETVEFNDINIHVAVYDNDIYLLVQDERGVGYIFRRDNICGHSGYSKTKEECIKRAAKVDGTVIYEFDNAQELFYFLNK